MEKLASPYRYCLLYNLYLLVQARKLPQNDLRDVGLKAFHKRILKYGEILSKF